MSEPSSKSKKPAFIILGAPGSGKGNELARRMRKRALKENRLDDASDKVIDQRVTSLPVY